MLYCTDGVRKSSEAHGLGNSNIDRSILSLFFLLLTHFIKKRALYKTISIYIFYIYIIYQYIYISIYVSIYLSFFLSINCCQPTQRQEASFVWNSIYLWYRCLLTSPICLFSFFSFSNSINCIVLNYNWTIIMINIMLKL